MNKKLIINRYEFFTKLEKKKMSYLDSLKYTLKHYKLNTNGKKKNLIDRLKRYYLDEYYTKNLDKIIFIQQQFKKKISNLNTSIKCINLEDFYTLEKLDSIDKDLVFYFIDNTNINMFDIRSFKKLIVVIVNPLIKS